jgi:bifunctional non-homologous end joining protein LigD
MASKQQVLIDGRELRISNLNKVFFPASGSTKAEVIAYYAEIADIILPHLRDRPLTLKRYPDGVTGEHFYEKNAPPHRPPWVKTLAVPRAEGGPDIHYVLCNDRSTLIWATNLADIEKHVFLATAPDLTRPTALVFDLDPGEPAGILDCAKIALHLRSLFDSFGLESFVKVSGSKGLHLYVPLNCDLTYEITQAFAKAVAEFMEQQMPDRAVAEMAKARRRGKVFIDWSQNSDFKTTVCVYSMRAKRNVPFVSMPVRWNELARIVKRGAQNLLFFTPADAIKRIERLGDLFEAVLTTKQTLPSAFTEAIVPGRSGKLLLRSQKRIPARDKSLREYEAKRNYARTPEPVAKRQTRRRDQKQLHRYVFQKHQASHLHYDLRLEMQGVLRSWAVPKGPPMKLQEARLAMHVEDHPIEYLDFEGTIPPKNYGAGTVMVWDRGDYEELSDNPVGAFYAGKLHLRLRGTKLKGEWLLLKDREQEESEKWLLIKTGEAAHMLSKNEQDRSVLSGRSMAQIAQANGPQWKSNRTAA